MSNREGIPTSRDHKLATDLLEYGPRLGAQFTENLVFHATVCMRGLQPMLPLRAGDLGWENRAGGAVSPDLGYAKAQHHYACVSWKKYY